MKLNPRNITYISATKVEFKDNDKKKDSTIATATCEINFIDGYSVPIKIIEIFYETTATGILGELQTKIEKMMTEEIERSIEEFNDISG